MPRRSAVSKANTGPSAEDLAEFRAAMGSLLPSGGPPALPSGNWARLTALVVERGYTLVVSPALGGRAYRVALPMGDKRVEVYISDASTAEQIVSQLLLAVQSLPVRE